MTTQSPLLIGPAELARKSSSLISRFHAALQALNDLLFGFDFFISYAWSDARLYAEQLAEHLRLSEFRCFLDSSEMPPGQPLNKSLGAALRRSRVLLVVVSPGSTRPECYVPREIATFHRLHGERATILPIEIGAALAAAAPDHAALGAALLAAGDPIRSKECAETLSKGPSPELLVALVAAFKFTRRNTLRLRAAVGAIALFALVAALAIWQWRQARWEANKAFAHGLASQSRLAFADSRYLERSVRLALASQERFADADSLSILFQSLALLPRPLLALKQGKPIVAVGVSQNGELIATADSEQIRVWNAGDGQLRQTFAQAHVAELAFDAAQPCLTAVSLADRFGPEHLARQWCWDGRESSQPQPLGGAVRASVSPDGAYVAWSDDGSWSAFLWDARGRALEPQRLSVRKRADAIAFSADGRYLGLGASEGDIAIRDLMNPLPSNATGWSSHVGDHPDAVAVSPHGRYFAAAGVIQDVKLRTPRVRIWRRNDTAEQSVTQVADLVFDTTAALQLRFSPDDEMLAVGGGEHVRVVEAQNGAEKLSIPSPVGLSGLAFTPGGRYLVLAAAGGLIEVWNISNSELVSRIHHGDGRVVFALEPKNGLLVTAGADGLARVWDCSSAVYSDSRKGDSPPIGRFDGEQSPRPAVSDIVSTASSYPPSKRSLSPDGAFQLNQSSQAASVTRLADHATLFTSSLPLKLGRFDRNSRWFAAQDWHDVLHVIDLDTQAELLRLQLSLDELATLSLNARAGLVAFGGTNGHISIWQLRAATPRRLQTLTLLGGPPPWMPGGPATISSLSLSADGKLLAASSADRIRVWSVANGSVVNDLPHPSAVRSLEFAPTRPELLTVAEDALVRLWNVDDAQVLLALRHPLPSRVETGRPASVDGTSASFTDDGLRIITTDTRSLVTRTWAWQPEELVKEARRRLTEGITDEEHAIYFRDAP